MQKEKLWRSAIAAVIVALAAGFLLVPAWRQANQPPSSVPANQQASLAATALKTLMVRPAASKSGYNRKEFSNGWAKAGTCTMRDKVLARDMTDVRYRSPTDCTVVSGTLNDPYTGKIIHFVRGPKTSSAVQIDHVVAISDAWQTGAQLLSHAEREQLYNDSLELIAADGPANEQKGDGDASTWLPPNLAYDCPYVSRQIAVKKKYHLWVTAAERAAMAKLLDSCPGQQLPTVN